MQYLNNGNVFGTAQLVARQVTLTSAAVGAGSHTINIAYSDDTNFKPAVQRLLLRALFNRPDGRLFGGLLCHHLPASSYGRQSSK